MLKGTLCMLIMLHQLLSIYCCNLKFICADLKNGTERKPGNAERKHEVVLEMKL